MPRFCSLSGSAAELQDPGRVAGSATFCRRISGRSSVCWEMGVGALDFGWLMEATPDLSRLLLLPLLAAAAANVVVA
ncbi:unnamed protein product [Urochloa humidicola]